MVTRAARAGSATKSLGQCCGKFIEFNFLQHVADIGAPGYACNGSQLLSQNSCEDVENPGADRHILFCSPMFVPALALGQLNYNPNFETDRYFMEIYKRKTTI